MATRLLAILFAVFLVSASAAAAMGTDGQAVVVVPNTKITMKYEDKTGAVKVATVNADTLSVNGTAMIGFKTLLKLNEEAHVFFADYTARRLYIQPRYDSYIVHTKAGDPAYQLETPNFKEAGEGRFAEASRDYGDEYYVPIELFRIAGLNAASGTNGVDIDLTGRMYSAALKSIEFGGARTNRPFSASQLDYALLDVANNKVSVTVTADNSNPSIEINGEPVKAGVATEISTAGLDTLEVTSSSADKSTKKKYSFRLRDKLEVQGKIMEANGKIVQTASIPQTTGDRLIAVPMRPVLEAFGYTVAAVDSRTVEATRYGSRFSLTVTGAGNAATVAVQELADKLGIRTEVPNFPVFREHVASEAEKAPRKAYEAAAKALAPLQSAAKKAEADYNAIVKSEPAFLVSGQINSRKPFYVWGYSYSTSAAPSHPGWMGAKNGNILVQNPDGKKISYGMYVNGVHYYKGMTTAKGALGQTVPVYIFGPPSASFTKKLTQAKQKLATANAALSKAQKGLDDKKLNWVKAIKGDYDAKIKSDPNNAQIRLDYAIALTDIASYTKDAGALAKEAATIADKASDFVPGAYQLQRLYAADRLGLVDQPDIYSVAAMTNSAMLLDYAATARQYWDAAIALEGQEQYSHASYAFWRAGTLGDAKLKAKTEAELKKINETLMPVVSDKAFIVRSMYDGVCVLTQGEVEYRVYFGAESDEALLVKGVSDLELSNTISRMSEFYGEEIVLKKKPANNLEFIEALANYVHSH